MKKAEVLKVKIGVISYGAGSKYQSRICVWPPGVLVRSISSPQTAKIYVGSN